MLNPSVISSQKLLGFPRSASPPLSLPALEVSDDSCGTHHSYLLLSLTDKTLLFKGIPGDFDVNLK